MVLSPLFRPKARQYRLRVPPSRQFRSTLLRDDAMGMLPSVGTPRSGMRPTRGTRAGQALAHRLARRAPSLPHECQARIVSFARSRRPALAGASPTEAANARWMGPAGMDCEPSTRVCQARDASLARFRPPALTGASPTEAATSRWVGPARFASVHSALNPVVFGV